MYSVESWRRAERVTTPDGEDGAAAVATSAVALTSRTTRSLIQETERIRMSASTGNEGLGHATELAPRLLENVETVVRGKRKRSSSSSRRSSAAAMSCSRTSRARPRPSSRARSRAHRGRDALAGAVHPDLQPTDVTGLSVFNQRDRDFEFRPGPVFANVVLVDEVNRAMPKTQSALLEAMAEQQVTIDGVTRELPDPFLVLATENPIEQEGTFPLPEAQLDRFFLRTALGYPEEDDELGIVESQLHAHPLARSARSSRSRT